MPDDAVAAVTRLSGKGPFQPIDNLPVMTSVKQQRGSPRGNGTTVSVRSVSKELKRQGSKELAVNITGSPTVKTVDVEHYFISSDGDEVQLGQPFATIRSVVKAIVVSVSCFKEGLHGDLETHNLKLDDVTRISFHDNPGYPIHLRPFNGTEKILTKEREEGKNGKDFFVVEWKKPKQIPAEFILKCSVDFRDAHLDVQPLSLRVGDRDRASSKGSCAVQ